MYKDKAKQREANRERQRRYKAKQKALPKQGVTGKALPSQGITEYTRVSDQDFTRLLAQVGPGHVRVSKPGDEDYVPMCETTRRFVDEPS